MLIGQWIMGVDDNFIHLVIQWIEKEWRTLWIWSVYLLRLWLCLFVFRGYRTLFRYVLEFNWFHHLLSHLLFIFLLLQLLFCFLSFLFLDFLLFNFCHPFWWWFFILLILVSWSSFVLFFFVFCAFSLSILLVLILFKQSEYIEVFLLQEYLLFIQTSTNDLGLLAYGFRLSIYFLKHCLHEGGLEFGQKFHFVQCLLRLHPLHLLRSRRFWLTLWIKRPKRWSSDAHHNPFGVLMLSFLNMLLYLFWIECLKTIWLNFKVFVEIIKILYVIVHNLGFLLLLGQRHLQYLTHHTAHASNWLRIVQIWHLLLEDQACWF